MNKILQRLLETLYIRSTPEQRAALFRARTTETRQGLEELLQRDEEDFHEVVPQVLDEQTGLYAKIYFEQQLLPQAIKRAEGQSVPLSLIYFDLDNFKTFNDTYGRPIGDDIISHFSALLKRTFRTKSKLVDDSVDTKKTAGERRSQGNDLDYIARYDDYSKAGRVGGGEEFAVILYDATEDEALRAANRFLDSLRRLSVLSTDGRRLNITASCGVAQYEAGMTPHQLNLRAQKAENYSKKQGRDRATAYSETTK